MPYNPRRIQAPGGFTADAVKPGSRYELRQGHPVYCEPTGGDGSNTTAVGASALGTDPDVESSGIDAGYTPQPDTLRAPDIAIGNVPDRPGWIQGVPTLAVEYASRGQDEEELQTKIGELLEAGTKEIWVVRLIGPRRVEVYAPNQPVHTLGPGEILQPPDGALRNPVPVEALYDRQAGFKHALRNLLQRQGYDSLDDVRGEGREEGREEGQLIALRSLLLRLLDARGTLPAKERARIQAIDDAALLEDEIARLAHA